MEPGRLWWSNFLNSALPPQRHRPSSRLDHKDPVSHTAQKKREKERKKDRKEKEVSKIKIFFYIIKKRKERKKIATKPKNKSTNDNKCYKQYKQTNKNGQTEP